ncbi:lysostaphin resistance A-like protein [Maribacter sp. 2307ULW6-5]|uniref:CPBP family intramembrane glutamic endopeptidase n=1 Tax=Maribacter sp. 2307ULW6-5 TaxID=3386275 RepID=UPI0039BD8292
MFLKFEFPENMHGGLLSHNFIISILLAPILEEYIYRYVIFEKLSEEFSLVLSILITSFLFSLMHSDLNGFLGYFFVSVVLTYLYSISKNLWLNIIFHSGFNVLSYLTVFQEYELKQLTALLWLTFFIISAIGLFAIFKKLKLVTSD